MLPQYTRFPHVREVQHFFLFVRRFQILLSALIIIGVIDFEIVDVVIGSNYCYYLLIKYTIY